MQVFDRGGGGTPRVPSSRILTVPNLISLTRLLVLPWLYLLITDGRYLLALVVATVFAATDWIDGYLARRMDQVTRLGQVLDPTSDRLFIITMLVAMVVDGLVPLWLAVALVLRDVLLLLAGAAVLGRGGTTPPVTRLGKTTTFLLMSTFPLWLLAGHLQATGSAMGDILWWVAAAGATVATVLYWVVGIGYARHLRAQVTDPA